MPAANMAGFSMSPRARALPKCSTFESLFNAIEENVPEVNWQLLKMRQVNAEVLIRGSDGNLTINPKAGGLMGRRNEPRLFAINFRGPILAWSSALMADDPVNRSLGV